MTVQITWDQVLAWRMKRHLLDPVGDVPVVDVVRRLCGVQAQVASSAELAIRLRCRQTGLDEVSQALADGRLIKTWAMRGTLHLLPADDAPTFLSLLSAGPLWADWQRYLEMSDAQMDSLREAILGALQDDPVTKPEIADAVAAELGPGPADRRTRLELGGLLMALAWAGELCHGPSRGTRVTFTIPERASKQWPGKVDIDVGRPIALAAYAGAYGPVTVDALSRWLASSASKREIRTWFEAMRGQMTEVVVDGEAGLVRNEDLDDLVRARPSTAVRLLAGFDQYVLGPGTKDGHVVPAARRAAVSRQSGWISPVVLAGGRVSGTWELDGDQVRISWFNEAGRPPMRALRAEVARLASVIDRDLNASITGQ